MASYLDALPNAKLNAKLISLLFTRPASLLTETRNLHFSYSNAFFELDDMAIAVRKEPSLVVLAVVLPTIYGGVHLSAWNFEFPTPTEHLLWKIMCFVIIGAVPAMFGAMFFFSLLLFCFTTLGEKFRITVIRNYENHAIFWADGYYKFVGVVVFAAYSCARLYLVVESFISLRRVPVGVYYTAPWLQMMPHA